MSALHMNRINRAYINRLKVKGVDWIKEAIKKEKALNNDETVVYIQALEKALRELESEIE